MAQNKSVDLTQGSIPKHVLRMLGPFSLAIVALLSAGIVDTIYLGRLSNAENPNLGILALAAIGFAFPITFAGNSANIGLGAGTMSAISRAIGEKDMERARRHGAAAILMAVLVMTLIVTFLYLTMPMLLYFAEGQVKAMAVSYLVISLPGLIIVSVAMMANNVLRAGGEAVLPSSIMILGAIINIVLDPFLIFGWGPFPRMEIAGAALATVIGNTIAALYGFYLVFFHRKAISFVGMTVGSLRRAWSIIGHVGIPAAGTNIIVPVAAWMAVNIIKYYLTDTDVAAFTVASRAELISVGVLYALSACIGAITGQNGGAGKTARVRTTFKTCYLICFIWSTFIAIVLAVWAPQIAGVFSKNVEVIDKVVVYFYIVPITIFTYGFVFVTAAGFNALGRPKYGLVFTIIRSLILYVSFIWLGVVNLGLTGAFIGVAAANLIAGTLAIFWSLKKAPMTARTS